MPDPSFRAVATLKAKRGLEEALVDFVLDAGNEIRSVEGLRRLEISRSAADPGQLLLYTGGIRAHIRSGICRVRCTR